MFEHTQRVSFNLNVIISIVMIHLNFIDLDRAARSTGETDRFVPDLPETF